MLPFEPLVCTIGPDFKNNPVSEITSSSEPPPLRRKSTTSPAMFSFFKRFNNAITSFVVLLA